MAELELSFQRGAKIIIEQEGDLEITSRRGAVDGTSILLKVAGNSSNALTFDSDFESLDGIAFDNTKMNHIYMIYDVEGNGTIPKTFYTIKQTEL